MNLKGDDIVEENIESSATDKNDNVEIMKDEDILDIANEIINGNIEAFKELAKWKQPLLNFKLQ